MRGSRHSAAADATTLVKGCLRLPVDRQPKTAAISRHKVWTQAQKLWLATLQSVTLVRGKLLQLLPLQSTNHLRVRLNRFGHRPTPQIR